MANENETVEPTNLQNINLAERFESANLKESLAPDLESNAPSEYREMIDCLKRGEKWTGPANAVRGFHFSPKILTEVASQGGGFYFFPQRPTLSQSEQIARLSKSASGWNLRGDGLIVNSEKELGVFCYAIIPVETNLDATVTVEPNADYFGLMGLKVVADETLRWKVRDKRIVY